MSKPQHDPQYVRDRDELIPEAERLTNKAVGSKNKSSQWSKHFIKTMDRLWAERGSR